MIQFPGVSPYAFNMKCIKVWQQLNLVSEKADIKYNKNFPQKPIFRAVERSIHSTFIIQEINHLLRYEFVSDKVIVC